MQNPGNVFICLVLLIAISTKAQTQETSNIGLKDMPSHLKKRFPICDKQLIVHWIHPEKYQGYSEYDTYNIDGRYIGRFKAFVNLGGASLTYKLAAYLPKDKNRVIQNAHEGDGFYPYFGMSKPVNENFDGLISLVAKHGLFYYESGTYNDEQSKTVYQITNNLKGLSLSNNSKNICVVYPDENYAWLVETKKIVRTHTKEQIDVIYERVQELYMQLTLKQNPEFHRQIFKNVSALDLNNDGVDDYLFGLDAIFSIKKSNDFIGYQNLNFLNLGCKKKHFMHEQSQLITDGKEFFWDDCNISELP